MSKTSVFACSCVNFTFPRLTLTHKYKIHSLRLTASSGNEIEKICLCEVNIRQLPLELRSSGDTVRSDISSGGPSIEVLLFALLHRPCAHVKSLQVDLLGQELTPLVRANPTQIIMEAPTAIYRDSSPEERRRTRSQVSHTRGIENSGLHARSRAKLSDDPIERHGHKERSAN